MSDDLQAIVDALADRLGRAVDIEDRRFRVLAYSPQHGQADSVRVASILQREAPPEVRRFLESSDLASITTPTRVRPPAGLGMQERVCVPVRWQGSLLGYLWLIDGERTLTDDELAAASEAAASASVMLYRERSLDLRSGRENRRLLHELLDPANAERGQVADALGDREVLAAPAQVAVIAVVPHREPRRPQPPAVRVALAAALERLGRESMPGQLAWVLLPDHGALLSSLPRDADPAEALRALAARLRARVDAALGRIEGGWDAHIGVGGPVDALADAHRSHAQAQTAARVAGRVDAWSERLALWSELGPYQLLSAVPELERDQLPAGLSALLSTPGGESFAATVETFLDLGGDVKATASALHLHRSSLYYRLHKAESITGTDLHSGSDRLMLHMALKLARLAGHYGEPEHPPQTTRPCRTTFSATTCASTNASR